MDGPRQHYFDPRALLAEETMMPCVVREPIKSVGRLLDPTSASEDLRAETQLELPLWLAKYMVASGEAIELDKPLEYREWMQRRVDAGAAAVSLRAYPNFYAVGMQCACTTGDSELAAFLRKTFSFRNQELLAGSLKAPDGVALNTVTNKLNEEEKTLFEAGRRGAAEQERWWAAGGQDRGGLRLSAGAVGTKRRRPVTGAAADKENAGAVPAAAAAVAAR